MPELPEQMYCSQQICIPPTFPFLLRTYAKAAIRTQPIDLLKWSTAYFRCLALKIPPPVKPRLEYPIPKSHFGLTPGWLRALLYQLQNNLTISFKVLWDRWTGACLEHDSLVEILCLGGFTDNQAIPWIRFVSLCAAHLTENLTQTMIMVCELFTEEPEGGSAMVSLETFTDIYTFLAELEASQPQELKNIYFTDSALGLCMESSEVEVKEEESEVQEVISAEISVKSEVKIEVGPTVQIKKEDLSAVVSCPDIDADDFAPPDDFEVTDEDMQEPKESVETLVMESPSIGFVPKPGSLAKKLVAAPPAVLMPTADGEEEVDGEGDSQNEIGTSEAGKQEEPEQEGKEPIKEYESADTLTGMENMPMGGMTETEFAGLRALGDEEAEEEQEVESDDDALKHLKIMLLEGSLASFDDKVEHYPDISSSAPSTESLDKKKDLKFAEEDKYSTVHVEAIPGIGPIVPPTLLTAVLDYMKEVSMTQHGMVMPRNIRHFTCPPLEIIQ